MPFISATTQVTARLLKWAVPSIACFLLCFSTAYAAGWVSKTLPDAPDAALCQALLYRLNHTSPRCTATAVAAYPGFKSPPWQTLDASKHIALIAKLLYVSAPFSGWSKALQKNPPPHWKRALAVAKGLVKEGYTLQIWHTRLLSFFDNMSREPTPPGDQTIALLSTKANAFVIPGCAASPPFRWSRTFVVLPDLSGPDLRVQPGTASILINNYPVVYKGQTLLMSNVIGPFKPTHEPYEYAQIMLSYTGKYMPRWACWFEYYSNDRNTGEE